MKQLITGGARSGKSRYALDLADSFNLKKYFVATAQPLDNEMKTRIEKHKAERKPDWITIEEPLEIAGILSQKSDPQNLMLIDCLALWTSNLLPKFDDKSFEQKSSELADSIISFKGSVITVTNEVGLGIVPADPQTRLYRDRIGSLNSTIAAVCNTVTMLVCGIPHNIKGDN